MIRADLTPCGNIEVAIADRGRWRPHRDDPHRGFGLSLAEGLVDDLIIDRAPTGTRVLLRRAVSRPTRTARHAHAVDGALTRDDERYRPPSPPPTIRPQYSSSAVRSTS